MAKELAHFGVADPFPIVKHCSTSQVRHHEIDYRIEGPRISRQVLECILLDDSLHAVRWSEKMSVRRCEVGYLLVLVGDLEPKSIEHGLSTMDEETVLGSTLGGD